MSQTIYTITATISIFDPDNYDLWGVDCCDSYDGRWATVTLRASDTVKESAEMQITRKIERFTKNGNYCFIGRKKYEE